MKEAHRKLGIGDSTHLNTAGFKIPIEVTPIEGRETLKSSLLEENFLIREFQENWRKKRNTETDRAQKTCEVEMSFVLVHISYECCGLFMKFNGPTILNWIA